MSQINAAALDFREVTKRYPGQAEPAVEALTLGIPAGEICVLVGPSGCGKTTAMRMVNRMIDMTDGDILLDGRSVRESSPAKLRREIGYAIQQTGLFPAPHRGRQHRHGAAKLLGWDKDSHPRARRRAASSSSRSIRTRCATASPAQLSGGQRQRIGVARSLAADPPHPAHGRALRRDRPDQPRAAAERVPAAAGQAAQRPIVFVTHDIDEAIKMGDKIAVMRQGGKLAQFASPAELLMAPADQFVEDFVGADRALKRLALQRVRDIDLWRVATVQTGEAVGEVRARVADADLDIPLLVDEAGRPLGWLSERALVGERVTAELRSPARPVVELDDVLRDALADLLSSETQYGPVVDARGRVAGLLSLEVIAHVLHRPPSEARSGAEMVQST